jgi:hypothetical protein
MRKGANGNDTIGNRKFIGMLVITNEQMEVFDLHFFNRFVDNACNDIKKSYPQFVTTEAELRMIVASQGKRAMEQYELKTVKWIFRFILLSFLFKKLREKEYPREIEDILTWPDRAERRKIEMLTRKLEA